MTGFEFPVTKSSPFRSWLWDRWYEHVDEIRLDTGSVPPYDPEHYFRFYKWWLKREFKYQIKKV